MRKQQGPMPTKNASLTNEYSESVEDLALCRYKDASEASLHLLAQYLLSRSRQCARVAFWNTAIYLGDIRGWEVSGGAQQMR